ncbi:MAG: carboxypeptidase regulatory-like domain-containing protein [Flavisolibacter sp.]|nr:carboxypeptidase regulatory-like domain-containing protein [Flavisolibacter sp.]
MKKIRTALVAFAIISTCFLTSFKTALATSIKGKVSPAWYAVHAWAISESDTLYTTITGGSFDFTNARPGVYRIIIEARSPYRHMAKV